MRRVPMYSLEGELIDYLEMPDEIIPPAEPTPDEQRDMLLAQLQEDNKRLKSQLAATIQSNQTLEDCLVEMASVVYA